jgi:hypothetical protein
MKGALRSPLDERLWSLCSLFNIGSILRLLYKYLQPDMISFGQLYIASILKGDRFTHGQA